MASYPSATPSFPTLVNNTDYVDASHPNNMADEIVAIAADIRAGLPIARGGTGSTTAAAAIAALFAGGQLPFPATQNASANANTLDDYEEGTWTPVIGGSGGTSGQSYAANGQVGSYIKIGKFVFASFGVSLSTKGTITSNVQIQGLPFTSENTTNQASAGCVSNWANLGTSWCSLSLILNPNSTAASLQGVTAAATGQSNLVTADISNTTTLTGSIMYRASA